MIVHLEGLGLGVSGAFGLDGARISIVVDRAHCTWPVQHAVRGACREQSGDCASRTEAPLYFRFVCRAHTE
jgi:hypothetical protein